MSDLLIVIPAYNEESNIEKVVDRLIKGFPQYDYLVINDGSRDRTGEICRSTWGWREAFRQGLNMRRRRATATRFSWTETGSTARSTWRP